MPSTARPLTFVAQDKAASGYAVILDTFEMATDDGFKQTLGMMTVPRGPDGKTSFTLTYLNAPNQTYYWHVRSGSGETVGQFSETFAFTIAAPVDTPASTGPLFADPPPLLSPSQGSLQNQHPTLVVGNASHTGPLGSNSAFYEFLLSTNPQSIGTVACIAYEFGFSANENACLLGGALSPGVYYWRARTVVGRRGFEPGVTSAVSAAWSFTVPPQILEPPMPLLPLDKANVHLRPALTVKNATHSGPVGAIVYQFEVRAYGNEVVARGTVPEGANETSWMVPFDLLIGTAYSWVVKAVDSGSGATSPYSNYASFDVVRAAPLSLCLTSAGPQRVRIRGASASSCRLWTSRMQGHSQSRPMMAPCE